MKEGKSVLGKDRSRRFYKELFALVLPMAFGKLMGN